MSARAGRRDAASQAGWHRFPRDPGWPAGRLAGWPATGPPTGPATGPPAGSAGRLDGALSSLTFVCGCAAIGISDRARRAVVSSTPRKGWGRVLIPTPSRASGARYTPVSAIPKTAMSARAKNTSARPQNTSGRCPAGPFSCPQIHAEKFPGGHVLALFSAPESQVKFVSANRLCEGEERYRRSR